LANKKPKIAIFVDVQNIYYTTKQQHHRHFNYNAFWQKISAQGNILKAFAYAISSNDDKQKQFQNILRGIGFEVKLKPYIQRSDGSAKGDWDVGITIDIMENAKNFDRIILLSGDGDFDLLAQKITKDFGVEMEVYGVNELTADSLKAAVTRFVAIDGELLL
jgi:uncharacterized LabA/DUF88 family protein